MTSFDPNQFLDQAFTDANDTRLIPVPAGEFNATAVSTDLRQWASKDDPTKAGLALDIQWEIDAPDVREVLGRTPKVKQGIMLDMNESQTGFDMGRGKNVGLGQLREALGMNKPGQPFTFSMIVGQMARVTVTHRVDSRDSEVVYAEIRKVQPL